MEPSRSMVNQSATRSEASSNWRTKITVSPRRSNNATSQNLGGPLPRDYIQLRNARLERQDAVAVPAQRLGESIRGEDDPRTLLAVAEGRRLYVGNLPYMAKTDDVKDLFAANEYQMLAIPFTFSVLSF
jgi:hypothetical protein